MARLDLTKRHVSKKFGKMMILRWVRSSGCLYCSACLNAKPSDRFSPGSRRCKTCAAEQHRGMYASSEKYRNRCKENVERQKQSNYMIWYAMVQRCHNPKCRAYKWYGARGISVFPQWRSNFQSFSEYMGDRPVGLTLERIDNNGNYEPGNLKWATRREQVNNRRTTRWITALGKTKCASDWADELGVTCKSVKTGFERHGEDYIARKLQQLIDNPPFDSPEVSE